MVSNQNNLLSESTLLAYLLDLPESLTHDSNKHVHENHCNYKRREQKHSKCKLPVIALSVHGRVKVTQGTQHVYRDYHISHWILRVSFIVGWSIDSITLVIQNEVSINYEEKVRKR